MPVAVLNFGSQYTHLIVRRIRELGVKAEILSPTTTFQTIQKEGYNAIVLSGGPQDAYRPDALRLDQEILLSDIPILGVCYGHQLMAIQNGGQVKRNEFGEYGVKTLKISHQSPLFKDIEKDVFNVWMSHSDQVIKVPEGAVSIGSTDTDQNAAIQYSDTRFSVQFHPEVHHTEYGKTIINNFLTLAKVKRDWDVNSFVDIVFSNLPETKGNILMGVSGGVDSTVVAKILSDRYPEKLHCVYVDTGLMRAKETEYVSKLFKVLNIRHFHVVNAKKQFLDALKGKIDPEEKRKAIGKTFIEVFEKSATEISEKYGEFEYLGQGTIYPDRIESSEPGKHAEVIKSHHNVGGLPEKLHLKLLEPIRDLYKDEVRQLGKILGIPSEFLKRQPFPGPGLAIRIIGEVTEERLQIVRQSDDILHQVLEEEGLTDKIWQFFAAFLPIKTVGVMGDSRTYDSAIAVRMVDSIDGMTADIIDVPKTVLLKISSRIVNEVNGINRVFYDITQKPPATIEFE